MYRQIYLRKKLFKGKGTKNLPKNIQNYIVWNGVENYKFKVR